MRRLAWLSVLLLMLALPERTLADSHHSSGYRQIALPCGVHLRGDDFPMHLRLQCTAGTAVSVSWNAVKVRPTHGNTIRARFTDRTVFETDSGEGVLDGLVSGDYVCVVYTSHASPVTALLVAFDPESSPCALRARPHFVWSGSRADGSD